MDDKKITRRKLRAANQQKNNLLTNSFEKPVHVFASSADWFIALLTSVMKSWSKVGARSFSAAAPKLWDGLPVELQQATLNNSFKS